MFSFKYLRVLIPCLLFASCATRTGYYNNLNSLVSQKRFNEAATFAETNKQKEYGEKNALLYYLDRGYLLHISGQYDESNKLFERAKKIAQEHFTKSITTEASTLLVSDNMRPYYGEDFERALINVFGALNYTLLGRENEALVEARQVDHFLKTLQVNHGYKNVYKEDAFARYLMGMLYENQGQLNDAYISYYQSLEAYKGSYKYFNIPAPVELVDDCVRLGKKLGFDDDIEKIRKEFTVIERKVQAGYGELVVFNYNGFAPEKVDTFLDIAFGKAWIMVEAYRAEGEDGEQVADAKGVAESILADEMIRIAFPKYQGIPYRIQSVEAGILDNPAVTVKGSCADNIGSLAKINLDDRINRIRVRAVVRAAIKFALSKKVEEKVKDSSNNPALTWLAKKAMTVASTATEKSDKRCWRSLPDKIMVVRLPLPEGKHSVKLTFRDASGNEVESQVIENIKIRPGKKTFASVRTAQ